MTATEAKRTSQDKAAGFTLLEFMMALLIMLIGLLSTATLIVAGVVTSMQSKDVTIANQLAKQAMEGVFMARIAGNLNFSSIYNKSQGGIFLDGYQPIKVIGPDGLPNTDLYAVQSPLTYVDPGKDNVYGTADDKVVKFDRFQRQILISDLNGDPNLRQVAINVQFTFKGITSVVTQTVVLSSIN